MFIKPHNKLALNKYLAKEIHFLILCKKKRDIWGFFVKRALKRGAVVRTAAPDCLNTCLEVPYSCPSVLEAFVAKPDAYLGARCPDSLGQAQHDDTLRQVRKNELPFWQVPIPIWWPWN